MQVYRLSPLRPDDEAWKFSLEKGQVWACALTPSDARDLVAAKSGYFKLAEPGAGSPWKDATITSCVEEPTLKYPGPGQVIREDGSPVDH